MTDIRNTDVLQTEIADRLPWTAPKIVTMAAGAAENAAGTISDDAVNFS